MTVFARVKTMNDTEMQNWLFKVGRANAKALGVALVAADQEVKKRVFRNMSPYARSLLAADVESNKKLGLKDEVIMANAAKLEKLLA